MDIKIKSNIDFCESLYDVAFGMAKSILLNGKKSAVRRKGEFVFTAKAKDDSVVVTIHADT